MEIPLLTGGESKVYIALVELNESYIGNIIKNSKVSHSKIYDILKRLAEKGLVSSINKNGKKYFVAANPSRLNNLIDKEKDEIKSSQIKINEIVEILNSKKGSVKNEELVSSFEGINGMKTVLEMVIEDLKEDDVVLILGSPKINKNIGGYLKDWQKRRIKTKIKCKLLLDKDSISWNEEWWDISKRKKLTFTKRTESISPAYLVITKKMVATIYFSSKIYSFIIKNEDISLRYKNFFNELWKK
ncbi:hypothetical protein J4436_00820 [Candidatus Woesearchaeota archaeon]|nr:hypothetical protein [Candidatus Woesearchaeota archaeon]